MRQLKKTNKITNRSSDQVGRYLAEVSKYPLISPDEEVRLARLIRSGGKEAEDAKRKLVEANLRFVINVANQYSGSDLELLDLISEGNIGLMKAAERFDDTRGFKFISYAVWWIRQSIMEAIAEKTRPIRVPLNIQGVVSKFKRANADCLQREERPITIEEFCDEYSLEERAKENLVKAMTPIISTNSVIGVDETTIEEFLESDDRADSSDILNSLRFELNAMMNRLSDRERFILKESFGFDNQGEKSLEEIAQSLDITRERVRQIKIGAIKKLQKFKKTRLTNVYL